MAPQVATIVPSRQKRRNSDKYPSKGGLEHFAEPPQINPERQCPLFVTWRKRPNENDCSLDAARHCLGIGRKPGEFCRSPAPLTRSNQGTAKRENLRNLRPALQATFFPNCAGQTHRFLSSGFSSKSRRATALPIVEASRQRRPDSEQLFQPP